jgi:hypothetical protein
VTVRDRSRALFADVSLDPVLRMGVGAYLVILSVLLKPSSCIIDQSELPGQPVLRRFTCTSSTILELQTVLWALEEHRSMTTAPGTEKLQVYSGSQCIAGLLKRRTELTSRCFRSGETARLLRNVSLYRRYYDLHDELDFEVIKLKGYTNRSSRDAVLEVFFCLDKYVRKALRRWMHELRTA